VKVLVVDDHTLVRRGLVKVVEERFPDAEVQDAGGFDEAISRLEATLADVALVDVRMPDRDGLELLKEIKSRWPGIPVILLTTYDHSRYVRTALAEGAAGYMLKDSSPEDLDQAIRVAISGGGNVLSTRAIRNLFEAGDEGDNERQGARRVETNLTQRELDIVQRLAQGHSNREISRQLYLSEKTVKAHLAAVFRKLGVTNRTQAAMMAVSMGLAGPHFGESSLSGEAGVGERSGSRSGNG
jgi:DNA-binding NarL/FixJ family response regulator